MFNLSMAQIWGTINSLQITAHVPLFNIKMPANLQDDFKILIDVVTFDYLNYFVENEDFGQSETEAFNENFNYLKYDTINIIQNMFSLQFFILFLGIKSFFWLVTKCSCRKKLRRSSCYQHNKHLATQAWAQDALALIFYEGYLEILICSWIGLNIYELEEMTRMDKICGVLSISFVVMLILFTIYLCWFVCYKSKRLVKIKKEI